jgi:hypothetical protein
MKANIMVFRKGIQRLSSSNKPIEYHSPKAEKIRADWPKDGVMFWLIHKKQVSLPDAAIRMHPERTIKALRIRRNRWLVMKFCSVILQSRDPENPVSESLYRNQDSGCAPVAGVAAADIKFNRVNR